jgi:hypothetical protein
LCVIEETTILIREKASLHKSNQRTKNLLKGRRKRFAKILSKKVWTPPIQEKERKFSGTKNFTWIAYISSKKINAYRNYHTKP